MTDKYAAWKNPAPEKTHWFAWLQKRIVHLIAVTLLIAAIIVVVLMQSRNAQLTLEQAAAAPVTALAEQYDLLLADAVAKQQRDEINTHLKRLVQSPLVRKAVVYDPAGNLLGIASSADSDSDSDSDGHRAPVKMQAVTTPDGIQTGILEMQLNDAILLNGPRALISWAFLLHTALLFTGLFAGILLTLLSWRYRYLLISLRR